MICSKALSPIRIHPVKNGNSKKYDGRCRTKSESSGNYEALLKAKAEAINLLPYFWSQPTLYNIHTAMKTIWILLLGLMVLSCKKDDVYNNIPNKYIPDNEIGDTLVFADSALAIIKYVCTGSNTSYYKYRNSSHYETYDQSYRGEFTPLVIDEEPLTINIFPSDVAVSLISNSLAKLRYQKSFSSVNSSSIFSEEIFGFTYNNLVNLVESYPGSSRHARYDLFKGIVSYQDTLGKEWKLKEIKR